MPQAPLNLPNAHKDRAPLRMCDRCDIEKPQAGGCQMRPGQWHCADCWKQARLMSLSRRAQR